MLNSKNKNEKRLARLCWNYNGWVFPSGKLGKSKNSSIHEAKFGYGHEEWLFDTSKTIDHYQYGFLEPVRKHHSSYLNNSYDVYLYTLDGISKKRYLVGTISDLIVITKEEAEYIKELYHNNGWLKEMKSQIKAVEASSDGFSNWKGVDLFNVKFKPVNLSIEFLEVSDNHQISKISRYTFAHLSKQIDILEEDKEFMFHFDDDVAANNSAKLKKTRYYRTPKAVEISHVHDQISINLTKYLKKKYGSRNVAAEHPAGYDKKRIDIVVNSKGELIFYEIKTYPSLHTSIREAVGQLLEYTHWTIKNKASKLIIVTQPHSHSKEAEEYLSHLRKECNIPIYHQSFDLNNCILSDSHSI